MRLKSRLVLVGLLLVAVLTAGCTGEAEVRLPMRHKSMSFWIGMKQPW